MLMDWNLEGFVQFKRFEKSCVLGTGTIAINTIELYKDKPQKKRKAAE